MKEIGGYFGLENDPTREEYHKSAYRFNLARSALEFLLSARKISTLYVPHYSCCTIFEACERAGTNVVCYGLDSRMYPALNTTPNENEYVYITNYFGQLSNEDILALKNSYKNIIVDNVQSFFQMPVAGVDTIYSCRKYFGVPDGAYLYAQGNDLCDIYNSLSYADDECNYTHIVGRIDSNASRYYLENKSHEEKLCASGVKKMPLSTQIMLSNINYQNVITVREDNFNTLHASLKQYNEIDILHNGGLFFYPFYTRNGQELRKMLISNKVYVPTLWPELMDSHYPQAAELTENIVYIPIDQRYSNDDMKYIVDMVLNKYIRR